MRALSTLIALLTNHRRRADGFIDSNGVRMGGPADTYIRSS